jgi:ferredoxin
LAFGSSIEMPGNCLIGIDFTNPPDVQRERLDRSHGTIEALVQDIRRRQTKMHFSEGGDSPMLHIRGRFMSSFTKYIYRPARSFRVDGSCSKCGTCARICTVGNIKVNIKQGPEWGEKCVYCLACLHWCPNRAVEMKKDTVGKTRYHHPQITVEEISAQSD